MLARKVSNHARNLRSEVVTELLLAAKLIADDLVTAIVLACLVQPSDLLLVLLLDAVLAANAGTVASIIVKVSVFVQVVLVLVSWHDALDVLPGVENWSLRLWLCCRCGCGSGCGILLVVTEVDAEGSSC